MSSLTQLEYINDIQNFVSLDTASFYADEYKAIAKLLKYSGRFLTTRERSNFFCYETICIDLDSLFNGISMPKPFF